MYFEQFCPFEEGCLRDQEEAAQHPQLAQTGTDKFYRN
jgi:hypothetical protein